MEPETLKLWFYKSKEYHYDIGEILLKMNKRTNYIYIVMQGVVAIELSDGHNDYILDLLGKGSIIKIFNLIFDEVTFYQARCVSAQTTIVRRIDKHWV